MKIEVELEVLDSILERLEKLENVGARVDEDWLNDWAYDNDFARLSDLGEHVQNCIDDIDVITHDELRDYLYDHDYLGGEDLRCFITDEIKDQGLDSDSIAEMIHVISDNNCEDLREEINNAFVTAGEFECLDAKFDAVLNEFKGKVSSLIIGKVNEEINAMFNGIKEDK